MLNCRRIPHVQPQRSCQKKRVSNFVDTVGNQKDSPLAAGALIQLFCVSTLLFERSDLVPFVSLGARRAETFAFLCGPIHFLRRDQYRCFDANSSGSISRE